MLVLVNNDADADNGIVTIDNNVHPWNALMPSVNVLDIAVKLILDIDVHPWKA